MSACSHEHHNALHGVHDHHNVEQRLAEAESLCSATGARLTPLRKEVLELILNATGPMGAYDLWLKSKVSLTDLQLHRQCTVRWIFCLKKV